MAYKSLQKCLSDLERIGELKIIDNEVNPDLDIATIHLNEFSKSVCADKIKLEKCFKQLCKGSYLLKLVLNIAH